MTHLTSPNLTSADLLSPELSGCKASQFAVAVTNQNRLMSSLDSPSAFTSCARPTALRLVTTTANWVASVQSKWGHLRRG